IIKHVPKTAKFFYLYKKNIETLKVDVGERRMPRLASPIMISMKANCHCG
ncbi:MAG: hypothetical protein H3Z52_15135, partial [archaeon]|nr:hypothetical protein [archaeon]